MTYRQLTVLVKSGLRKARKSYRSLDTKLQAYERELDRLILRKTLVEPKSLQTAVRLWSEASALRAAAERALTDAVSSAAV